jgi:O-methyltransferase involved in polyketide biosynthesis
MEASATDESWLKTFPADRRILIITEGIFMYLEDSDAENLIRRLVRNFRVFDKGNLFSTQ